MVAAMMGTVTMKAERAGTTRDRVCAGYAAGSERYILCSSCPPRAHAACAQPLLISAVLPFWLSSPRLSPPLPRFRYLPPPLPAAPCRRPAPSPLLSPSYASGLLSLCWEGSSRQVVLILAAACTSTHPIDSHSIRPAPCYPPLHTAGLGYPRTASFNAMCFTLLLPQAAVDAQRPTMVVSFYHCRHLQHRRLRGASSGLTPLTVIISV